MYVCDFFTRYSSILANDNAYKILKKQSLLNDGNNANGKQLSDTENIDAPKNFHFLCSISSNSLQRTIVIHRTSHNIIGSFCFVLFSIKEKLYFKFRSVINVEFSFVARLDHIDPFLYYFDIKAQQFIDRSCDFKLSIDPQNSSSVGQLPNSIINIVYKTGHIFKIPLPNKFFKWVKDDRKGTFIMECRDMCHSLENGTILPVNYSDFAGTFYRKTNNLNSNYDYSINRLTSDADTISLNGSTTHLNDFKDSDTTYKYGYWKCENNRGNLILCDPGQIYDNLSHKCCETNPCLGKPDGLKFKDKYNHSIYYSCENSVLLKLNCSSNTFFNGAECIAKDICHRSKDGTRFPVHQTIQSNRNEERGQNNTSVGSNFMSHLLSEKQSIVIPPNMHSLVINAQEESQMSQQQKIAQNGGSKKNTVVQTTSTEILEDSKSDFYNNSFIICRNYKSTYISCEHISIISPDRMDCIDLQCLRQFDYNDKKYINAPLFMYGKETNTIKQFINGCLQCNDNGKIVFSQRCDIKTKSINLIINKTDIAIANKWKLIDSKLNHVNINFDLPCSIFDEISMNCVNIESLTIGNEMLNKFLNDIQPVYNTFLNELFPCLAKSLFVDIRNTFDRYNGYHLTDENLVTILRNIPLYNEPLLENWKLAIIKRLRLEKAYTSAANEIILMDYFNRDRMVIINVEKNNNDGGQISLDFANKELIMEQPYFVYKNRLVKLKFYGSLSRMLPVNFEMSPFTPHLMVHRNLDKLSNYIFLNIGNHILEYIDTEKTSTDTGERFEISENNMSPECIGLGLGNLQGIHIYNIESGCWCNDKGNVVEETTLPCVVSGFTITETSRFRGQCSEQTHNPLWMKQYHQHENEIMKTYKLNSNETIQTSINRYGKQLLLNTASTEGNISANKNSMNTFSQLYICSLLRGTYYAVNSSYSIIDDKK